MFSSKFHRNEISTWDIFVVGQFSENGLESKTAIYADTFVGDLPGVIKFIKLPSFFWGWSNNVNVYGNFEEFPY